MNESLDQSPIEGRTPTAEPGKASFSTTIRRPRFWRISVVGVSGLILLISAALAFGASPAPSGGVSPQPPNGSGSAGAVPWSLPGLLDPQGAIQLPAGKGFDRGLRFGRFGGITVTAINGSNLSLKTDDGWTRTIAITSSTKITKGGQTISASDLKVGDSIGLGQTRNDDGSFSIDSITVLVPQVAGTVSDVTSNGFTLKARDGTTWTITVTDSTSYRVGSARGTRSDVKAGVDVIVAGNRGSSDTSLTALTVQVRLPVVFGEVTAKNGNTITIKRGDGTTQTVHVGNGTTYKVAGVDNAQLSDIAVGMQIVVQGAQRSDGSIDATIVAGGFGHGPRGNRPGFLFPPGFNRNGGQNPQASGAPDGSASQS